MLIFMASSTDLLPSDVMFEILTRTPSLETLDTCNKVSKGLKHLIHEPTFMHTYCQRTKNVSGFFTQCMKFGENVSRFVSLDYHNDKGHASMVKLPRSDMDILASCRQGILCCQRREDIREYIYSVCKPTTGQIQDLPSPGPIWETVSMSIIVLSSSPLRYKIIRLWTPSVDEDVCNNSYYFKIFDSETWEWRDAGVIKFPIHETIIARSSQPVTTADNPYTG
ncbi:hypothetical protein CASFOL_036671 [Castilleja foliolosa]|uniref:F-box domain-containing protein n=1 Tax=Castilleja foliolosa TaxID=1961234 RepID=A0ABD3BNM4_9LAMI